MNLNSVSLRVPIAICFTLLAVLYVVSWLMPAVGLHREDAVYLVTAKALAAGHGYTVDSLPTPVPETTYPPLFPALLALFTMVSQNARWLKLLPLLCTAGWLWVTYRLLRKMGATKYGALLLVFLTAASPLVIFISTSLLTESLFGLLVAGSLLMLLEDRPWAAGALAGLATLTRIEGAALIVACILTLVVRRRFGSATKFAALAMLLVAPWFGWSLALAPHDVSAGAHSQLATNIITGLPANEKAVVLARNSLLLLQTPFSLLTGFTNLYTVIGTIVLFVWCLWVRRQLLPDLFIAFYCLFLLCRVWPPQFAVTPVLPLILWIIWRVLSRVRIQEAVAAAALIIAGAGLWSDGARVPKMLAAGTVPAIDEPGNNWHELEKLFAYIRARTAPSSVLLGNLDPLLYLGTGRKAVRGFAASGFGLYYAPREIGVTPDELSNAILRDQVDYVVLTPDSDFAESPSFHASIRALERGGVLQPVPISGISPEYRLLRVH